MKNFIYILGIFALVFTACEGDPGPPGPQGPPGEDASPTLATIFEVTTNFAYESDTNLWTTGFLTFSDFTNVEVFEEDVVLVYRLDSVGTLNDGSTVDQWSLIPQNFFTDLGTIQYVFNHTFIDVEIFIDGNYNLSNLNTGFTDNQDFRIVIIPADFAENFNGDFSDFSAVMSALELSEKDVQTL